jgi:hydroxyacylglutathione hydrolase
MGAMPELEIHQIPVLRDNYVYLVREAESKACAAVDPSVAEPVLAALDRLGWRLTHILNTHHHHDHVGGNLEIKRATGCAIVGNGNDARRIPGIDIQVHDGDTFRLGAQKATVIDVSGHTIGHIAYWFGESKALFCGDTLFALGCGRLFEGTPGQMWSSLCKLRALPEDTKVYCGHEYTKSNADFALTVEPENSVLKRRADTVAALRAQGLPTVPSTIGEERATNPFLRADNTAFRQAAGLAGLDEVATFAAIRRRKDTF